MQPYPPIDHDREARVVEDSCVLLHDDGAATKAKVKRWIRLVLADAESRRKWWFLENVASVMIDVGQDVIDLKGHIDKTGAIYCPNRLHKKPLAHITALRMDAAANNKPNAGYPTHYAIEAGLRIHLWPCPHQAMPFAVLYTRPMDLAIVPALWEAIVLDGVLGRFGRHFDRDALTQDPAEFERRYEAGLKRAAKDSFDVSRASSWDDVAETLATAAAGSATDTAIGAVVPASITGIGYVTLETGDYPMTVG